MSSDGFPAIAVSEFIVCVQQNFSAFGMTFETGVYFLCVTEKGIPVGYVKHLSAIPSEQEVVHKLDSKYIDAEWMANRSDSSEEVLAEASQKFYSSGSCRQSFQFALEAGETYAITWDGEKHVCKCNYIAVEDFQFPYIVNLSLVDDGYQDTGEPFCLLNYAIFYINLGTMIFAQSSGSETYHTVGVYREGNVRNRIPFEYLPNSYTFPSDLSYMKTRIFV